MAADLLQVQKNIWRLVSSFGDIEPCGYLVQRMVRASSQAWMSFPREAVLAVLFSKNGIIIHNNVFHFYKEQQQQRNCMSHI